jgi:hypothetical protein
MVTSIQTLSSPTLDRWISVSVSGRVVDDQFQSRANARVDVEPLDAQYRVPLPGHIGDDHAD